MSILTEPDELLKSTEVLNDLRSRFELMFDDPNLRELRGRDPTHAAVEGFDAAGQLLSEGDNLLAEHVDVQLLVSQQWMNMRTWGPQVSGDRFWGFLPDEATRARTVSGLADSDQHQDTLAELFYWGWLEQQGLSAVRVEEEGVSDIVIRRGASDEVRVEVKRIRAGSDPLRVAEVIKKANKQIKKSDPQGGGVVFISLNVPMRRALPDEAAPNDVQRYVEAATRATRVNNSSVGKVVLSWDDFMTHGEWPELTTLAVRRRSVVVDHANPLVSSRLSSEEVDIGMTLVTAFMFSPSESMNQTPEHLLEVLRGVTDEREGLGPCTVRMSEHPPGGRPRVMPFSKKHVESAFRAPDAVAIHALVGKSAVVTKRVTTHKNDFLLVVHAGWLEQEQVWLIDGGYRLYDDEIALDRLQLDANEAFATVLQRYATRYDVGVARVWWMPEICLQLIGENPLYPQNLAGQIATACGCMNATQPGTMSAVIILTEDERAVRIGGLYWIQATRYEAAAIHASRSVA